MRQPSRRNAKCEALKSKSAWMASCPMALPKEINIDLQSIIPWGQIRDKAVGTGVITKDDLPILKELRDRGNFTAHYGQIFDQRIRSYITSSDGLRLWADEGEALDTLRKAAAILNNVATWIGSH